MKPRLLIPTLVLLVAPFARAGAVYVVAQSFTPGYEALDMTVDQSVADPFTNPYFNQVQQDSISFTGSWYFNRTHKGVHQVDLNVGANVTTVDSSGPAGKLTATDFKMPAYLRYNYNIEIRHSTFVYAGVLAGGTGAGTRTNLNIPGRSINQRSDSSIVTGMCGVGVGVRHFGDHWGVEVGYDYRLSSDTSGAFDTFGRLAITARYREEHVFSLRGIILF